MSFDPFRLDTIQFVRLVYFDLVMSHVRSLQAILVNVTSRAKSPLCRCKFRVCTCTIVVMASLLRFTTFYISLWTRDSSVIHTYKIIMPLHLPYEFVDVVGLNSLFVII